MFLIGFGSYFGSLTIVYILGRDTRLDGTKMEPLIARLVL